MDIKLRLESKQDYRNVENITREAFWDIYKPGCDEHLIVHQLRKTSAFIKELDYIACSNELIVGNIMYSVAKVINEQNQEFEVLCMGPLCVLPAYQRKGIGALLINESIEKAKHLNYKAVFIYGNPHYYHRFGFKNAEKFHIQTAIGTNIEAFMALELYEGSLNGSSGRFYEDKAFEVSEKELQDFDKEFQYKEKHMFKKEL